MKRLLLIAIVTLSTGGCLTLSPPEITPRDLEILTSFPVKLVVLVGDDGRSQVGSAVAISPRELIVSDHQIPSPSGEGSIFVAGLFTTYRTLQWVRGATDAGGWARVLLHDAMPKPIPPLEIDFRSPLPVGTEIFVVSYPQPDGEPTTNRAVAVVGARVRGLADDVEPCVRELIPISATGLGSGSSGGGVFRRLNDGSFVLVAIFGGIAYTAKEVIPLIYRPVGFS